MKKILLTGMALGLVAMQSIASDVSSKSGFLLGLDWSMGLSKGSGVATDMPVGGNNGANSTANFDNKTLSNSAKLVLGYQKYFEKVRMLGFNIKSKAGVGFAQMGSVMTKSVDQNGQQHQLSGEGVATAYIPLTLSIESNLLFDFVESGSHVFGGSVGFGYGFVYGVSVDNVFKNNTANLSMYADAFNANPMNYQFISPKVGFHYYYANHQLGVDVSFDKVLDKRVVVVRNLQGANNQSEQTLITDLNRFCTVSLSYAYRF